ncbi:MAG: TonB-dependent receptor [Bacteroidales bacterium]|nr:TonB-dependent receptor [Bacteroidales bacterium]
MNLLFKKRLLSSLLGTFLLFGSAAAQNGPCTVTVKDSSGEPLPGAAALIKGTKTGEVADANGVCHFSKLPSDATLVVSCLGFEDLEVAVRGRQKITVTLSASATALDEVIMIGYGAQRRKDLSGAITRVSGETINEFSTLSAANALQGRVSGVQVNTNTGQPGANVQIRIRGTNSIKGDNEPLWIINGFPGDINMINSSDIASMEILKDASATAIYGSRGANGVVIVTTKGAREGDLRVEYSGSAGVQTLTKQLEMADAWEYMEFLNAKAAVNGNKAVFTQEEIDNTLYSTNWQDEVFRPALITDHALSISGGTQKLSAGMGLSYFKQDGIVKTSGYERLSLRTDVKYNLSKVVSTNAGIVISRSKHAQNGSSGVGGTINNMLISSPTATPHWDDGTWNDFSTQPSANVNPVAALYETQNDWYADRMTANAGVTIRPIDGLSISISGNARYRQARKDYFKSLDMPGSLGAASIDLGEVLDLTSNNIVTYDKFFARKHHLTLMGGMTYESYTSKSTTTGTAENFISDAAGTYDIDAAEEKGLPSSSLSDWRLLSYLGRINYNYDDRYILTVNFRADGSSRYNKGNKWGYFPSAAAAWRISEEHFVKDNVSWLSNLKLRAGYGITGSTAISPYATLNTLTTQNVVFGKDTYVAYAPADKYVGDLRWEQTAQTNVGLDLGLFRNRVSLTVDAYYKLTTDLLNDVEMPRSSGYTTALRNIGSVSNRGIEAQLDARIIDKTFKWDLGANFSLNRSRVESLADGKDIFGATVSNTVISDQLNILREGEEMCLFYGYVEAGYDDKGQIVYVDDIDGVPGLSATDKQIIGNPNPRFLLNFNTTLSYKRVSLSAFFQGSFGADIYALTLGQIAYQYGYNGNVLKDVIGNYWTADNPDAKYPNLLQNVAIKMSDRFVYDGSYLKVKNVELGYDIPCERLSWLSKARVYVSGQNLYTFTSYPLWDPDVNAYGGGTSLRQGVDSSCYPTARSFTVGCRVTF